MIDVRDPAHYLKPLAATNTPKRLMWLDCAAVGAKEAGTFIERWRCGALGTTHWTSRKGKRVDKLDTYDYPKPLWECVDGWCTPGRRTVLWAYDLAYQLRVSQALLCLPALGWTLDKIVLERTAAWARFVHGKRSLMCCDLKSWTPVELDKLRNDLDAAGFIDRGATAGANFHTHICRNRAVLVREAVLQILAWMEGENLGPFRPTGSGQSYAAYRRRFMSHRLLVHDDVARLQAERTAMWTGRCEAWRHGDLNAGPYVEYDMHAAYATIARDCDVPVQAAGAMRKPNVGALAKALVSHAVLAHCRVKTDLPVVPTMLGGRTVWPVGEFNTWLWDPELTLAMDYATEFECHSAYKYTRAPALRDFAAWVLDGMGDQETIYGPIPRRALKHWSRCLVGRLGLRYRAWEPFGAQDPPDLRLVTFLDVDEGIATDMLIAGSRRMLLSQLLEGAESLPQIPSWVMSECRRRLWVAMTWLGLDRVAYVDTDSVIVAADQDESDAHRFSGVADAEWTRKGTYERMHINGPRNLVCATTRRMSGLPLSARQVAPLEFTGQVMRSVKESMRAGELDCVASTPRKFVMDAPDLRRQHIHNHRTLPFEVHLQPKEE